MTTKIPVELSSTPSIVDGGNATAITIDSSENIVLSGALDGGSITSGFGSIDVGSSAITTSGTVTGGTLAGTLSTAAQTNITSVGTLTGLTVEPTTAVGLTYGADGTNSFINFEANSVVASVQLYAGQSSGGYFAIGTKDSGGTLAERLRIDASGNVGIGASSALDNKLEVNGGDIRVRGTSTPTLKLNNGDQEVVGMRLQSGAAGVLSFHTNKVSIDSYGGLNLNGEGAADGYAVPQDQSLGYTNNLNAGAFGILHRAAYDSYITGNAYYYRTGGSSGWRAKYGAYKSTVMSMVDGAFNFDCSSAAPGSNGASVSGLAVRARIDSDGLKFGSDTAAANALDDYEEGTYIPTWTTVTGNPASYRNADNTANTNTNGLSYVKIGRQVTISGAVFFTAGSSINNQRPNMTIPYVARVYSVSGVISSYVTGSQQDVHYLNYAATNSINLYKLDSSGSHVAFGTNGAIELYINITYQTYA